MSNSTKSIIRFGRLVAFITGASAIICAGWNPMGIATILLGGFMVFWGFNYCEQMPKEDA